MTEVELLDRLIAIANTILVTAATGGFGRSAAQRFASEGAAHREMLYR
jgi:NADP-dependent 3-hydroxy acid dehydrogenase YdfG